MLRSSFRHPLTAALILVLLGLIGFALYVVGWQAWAEYHYRAALRDLDKSVSSQTQEHLAQAKAHFQLCLKVRPNSLDVNYLAARTSRRLLAYDDAEAYLRQYKKLDGVPEAWELELGLIQTQRGDLSKEGFLWSCVQNDHPDKIVILEALTRAYFQTYQLPSALECLKSWLDLQPNSLQALTWRGRLQRMLSEYNEAIQDYERALKLDPDCDEARLNLAEVLIYTHKAKDAMGHFEILTERQPGNSAAVLGLGRCKAEVGELEEARKLFDRLLFVNVDDPTVLAESGKLLLNTGQYADAEARLRDALRLAPYDREALYNMYKCLEQRGKKEEAKKYLEESNRVEKDLEKLKETARQIMKSRKDPSLRCQAAEIYLRNGMLIEAKRWLDDALRIDPHYTPAYLLYAEYYDRIGQTQRAAECRQRARQPGAAP